jgi:hypothetical protein
MNNVDPARAETVFAAALHRRGAAERSAYLDQALLRRPEPAGLGETLLRAHDGAGDFLGPAAAQAATQEQPGAAAGAAAAGPGTRVGNYKLLQQIGDGGFGLV